MTRDRRPELFALFAVVACTLPFVYTVFDDNDGDIPLYHRAVTSLAGAALPYRDFLFEYPPYALSWFLLPALAPGYAAFRIVFALQLLALDVVAKVLLWREGARLATTRARAHPQRGPRPSARFAPVLFFSIGGVFQAYFYLKRLDVIAATLGLFALVAFAREKYAWAGALLVYAIGTKLYPALMAPALLFVAYRRSKARPFVVGCLAALAPIALVSIVLPWWRFASFHAARGLQVESTYASILWLLHLGGLDAEWVGRAAWMEVEGPAARALLPIARVVFGLATISAVVVSVVRSRDATTSIARLARITLVPVLAFMAFNIVLSPQYAIWLLPLGALAAIEGTRAPIVALAVAIALTTFLFPAPDYLAGYHLPRAIVLFTRNMALLAALGLLVRERGDAPTRSL